MTPAEIRVATLVRAPRERVYDAFTRADELDSWFTTGAEVDPRLGGELVWRWVDWGPDRYTGEDRGPVLEARRPERYVFRWQRSSAAPRSRSASRSIPTEPSFAYASTATPTRPRAGRST